MPSTLAMSGSAVRHREGAACLTRDLWVVEPEAPALGSPVFGAPVLGTPVLGTPVLDEPVLGTPVLELAVAGTSKSDTPVTGVLRFAPRPPVMVTPLPRPNGDPKPRPAQSLACKPPGSIAR